MQRLIVSVGGIPAVLAAPATALAQPFEGYGYHGWGSGWGHMLVGGLMMILFWGGLIVLAVVLVRWLGRDDAPGTRDSAESSALEILRRRYARGEIDREEFEQRRRDLE